MAMFTDAVVAVVSVQIAESEMKTVKLDTAFLASYENDK